ncbi:Ubiquitin-conjugating_enzyme E2 [Hexamita inflata]|uniref:Ubiquitin-conjugating enzyme E2 n=1 Tax=Hexamita inflata TaxID=28002 RepID=A0AA86PIX6_9EUKA|nr:Ubiquitin-conjugating enzyme E2 [Hexamita inflata]
MTDQQTKMKILARQFGELKLKKNMSAFFPDKKNPFMWHISFKGPEDSEFQEGIYHCQMNLANYPDSPPEVMLLNESGAYVVNTNICIVGLTHYHPEGWTPGTSIEAIVTALQMLMQITKDRSGYGVIPTINSSDVKKYSDKSKVFTCKCGADHSKLFQ